MEPEDPAGRKHALLSLRSAFVLTLALLVALAAGGLLYAAHHSIALAVLGAGGAFAAAVTFFNILIELPALLRRPICKRSTTGARHHDHVDLYRPSLAIAGDPLDLIDAMLDIKPEKRSLIVGGLAEPDPLRESRGRVAKLSRARVRANRACVLRLDRQAIGDITRVIAGRSFDCTSATKRP